MSSVSNEAFGCLENYITDVAVTVMVGLGYYLIKGIKRKTDDFSDPESGLKNLKGKLEGALQRWQYAKSIEEYNELIKSDYNKDGIEDPFSIINLMNKNGILPTIDTYNALLLNTYSKNNEKYAEVLKEEILDPCGPVTPNNFTLNVLIKGLNLKYNNIIKNKKSPTSELNKQEIYLNFDHELMSLLKTLEDRNIYMDLIGQNTILDSLVDQGRLNEAWSQYTCMKKRFKPDMYTYSTIIRGIKKTPELSCDWLDKAFSILNEVTLKNEIDETFFNSLLDSCVKFKRIDRAEELYNQYADEKKVITEHSYSIMIKGYSNLYKLEKAEKMFLEIKNKLNSKNQKLNVITYGAMMNTYFRCKNVEKAEELLKEMEEFNIEINSYIYSTLINGYKLNRKYEKALVLFDKILKNFNKLNSEKSENKNENNYLWDEAENIKHLNIVFFNTVLDCCVESNKIDKMVEIFEYIQSNQYKPNFAKIDMITYSIIIKGFAKSNKKDKVSEIYSYLRTRKDFILDEMLYNSIIDCYAKHSDEINALKVFEDMKKVNVAPTVVTYGVLIKLYCNLGKCNEAFELFDESVKLGIKPSVVIFQTLIKSQIKLKLIDRAITIFRNMILSLVKADQIIYEVIIKGCLEQSREKEAGEFIVNALQDNIKVENYIMAAFVDRLQGETNFKHLEKLEFIPLLIQVISTKSMNVELHSLNLLNKMKLTMNKSQATINIISNTSLYTPAQPVVVVKNKSIPIKTEVLATPTKSVNTSVYAMVSNNKITENKQETVSVTEKGKNSYIFDVNTGIMDLKGFCKSYVTVSNGETPVPSKIKENKKNSKKVANIMETKKEESENKKTEVKPSSSKKNKGSLSPKKVVSTNENKVGEAEIGTVTPNIVNNEAQNKNKKKLPIKPYKREKSIYG